MTAPVWMASAPEVLAALLSSGPGPSPLLAAAAQWHQLSAEYLGAAVDLERTLTGVETWSWQGPSADRYAASHLAFLGWLVNQGEASAVNAAQLETVAAAYTAAVGAMPSLSELGANHVVHGALVATNIFGINTIPLAINEADYVRMWIQAATTMEIYQGISAAAVMSAKPSDPPPRILAMGGETVGASSAVVDRMAGAQAAASGSALSNSNGIADQLEAFLRHPLGTLRQILTDFTMNPAGAALTWGPLLLVLFAVYLTAHGTSAAISWGLVIGSMGIWLPFVVGAALQMPAADGGPAPSHVDKPIRVATGQDRPESPPTITSAPSGAPAPAATAPAAPSSVSATAPTTAASPAFPYVAPPAKEPPPAVHSGPTLDERDTNPAPASGTSGVAAAAAPAQSATRRRRHARAKDPVRERMHVDATTNPDFDEPVAQSARQRTASARGLIAGESDAEASRALPMLPTSWDARDGH